MTMPSDGYPETTPQGQEFLKELDNRIEGGGTATIRAGLFRAMRAWVLSQEALMAELQEGARVEFHRREEAAMEEQEKPDG